MNQYITEDNRNDHNDDDNNSKFIPKILKRLPNNRIMKEIWAGSEYTIVSDTDGYLWSTGWNEHGNLGNGHYEASNGHWSPIVSNGNQIKLSLIWEGSLACGGGHVLCSVSS